MFKDTEIGSIPEDWKVMKLGEKANVRYGLGQPPALETNGIPMIRATNVKRGKIAREGLIFINPNAVPNSRDPLLRARDILVVRSGAYTGDVALVTKEWEGAVAGYDLIVSPSDAIDSEFLTYYLLSPWVQKRHFMGLKVRSAQPHLNSSQLEETPIPLPPLPEQKKIAEILSTVDQAIEKVGEAIEKTRKLKKGLMQELLTKGIGRKEFKDTEIGRIPREWAVSRLGEISKLERGKFAFRPRNDPRFYNGKYPFIQTGDIGEANGIIKTYSQTLNEEGFKISKLFKKGTIVISIAGNIGDVGILNFDSCFPDSVVGISANDDKANTLFLMYLLQGFKTELNSIAPRSTQKNINLEILGTFKLPIPPLTEQQKIAEILSGVDGRLDLLSKRKERLEKVKKGVMNDLLMGRKRVRLEV